MSKLYICLDLARSLVKQGHHLPPDYAARVFEELDKVKEENAKLTRKLELKSNHGELVHLHNAKSETANKPF